MSLNEGIEQDHHSNHNLFFLEPSQHVPATMPAIVLAGGPLRLVSICVWGEAQQTNFLLKFCACLELGANFLLGQKAVDLGWW